MERKPIVLSHNAVALIQVFTKYDEWLDISIGAWDRFFIEEGYKEAAKEFVRQLKDQWCEAFMEELKKVRKDRGGNNG